MAAVIGMVKTDLTASLVFVHRDCIILDVLGEDVASRIIARERGTRPAT